MVYVKSPQFSRIGYGTFWEFFEPCIDSTDIVQSAEYDVPTFTSVCCGLKFQRMLEATSALNLTWMTRSLIGLIVVIFDVSWPAVACPPNPVAWEWPKKDTDYNKEIW